jgi:hypothetical protein
MAVSTSRVEWLTDVAGGKYVKVPQGLIDMHVPEHRGFVHFAAR